MKTSRLFEIIYILLSKERVTAKEFAERFEVSTRTIYRDVEAISMAGIPIYTEKGSGGGISLLPGFVLNKTMFSEVEQKEILSAIQGVSRTGATGTDHILQKLSVIFDRVAVNWLEIDFAYWGRDMGCLWEDIKTAILERQIIEFDYYSSFSEKTNRRVEPLQLWFKFNAWYIKGFCIERKEMRTFKLTRIKELTVTRVTFAERESLDNAETPTSEEHDPLSIKIRLRIAPEMTYRVMDEFANDETVQEADGSYLVTIYCHQDNWINNLILSFGEYAEVLEPQHIRDIIAAKARKISEKYL
ncbi:MAG: YafY family transcriptional regulator [Lachnospiraceae bacterium]|jgi:predicted DNA-binding transcriptional regulator YafY|nr:YafY family transcriptional regulator [Lachnospiraceae bacterium]